MFKYIFEEILTKESKNSFVSTCGGKLFQLYTSINTKSYFFSLFLYKKYLEGTGKNLILSDNFFSKKNFSDIIFELPSISTTSILSTNSNSLISLGKVNQAAPIIRILLGLFSNICFLISTIYLK
jgi:hypothetical protein